MFEKMYQRVDWKNGDEAKITPISAKNLNIMDFALKTLDDRTVELDVKKAELSTVLNMISDWTMDEKTGHVTITKLNGEKIIFDMNLEKIPINFSMSEDGVISMVTEDGSVFTADISNAIPVITFDNSDSIAVDIAGDDKDKTYTFYVKDGSITPDKLQPNYLAEINTAANTAELSAISALASENAAKSSETNAKSSEEAAKVSENKAAEYANNASESVTQVTQTVTELSEELITSVDAKVEEKVDEILSENLDAKVNEITGKVEDKLAENLDAKVDDIVTKADNKLSENLESKVDNIAGKVEAEVKENMDSRIAEIAENIVFSSLYSVNSSIDNNSRNIATNANDIADIKTSIATIEIVTVGENLDTMWREGFMQGPIEYESTVFMNMTYGNGMYVAIGGDNKIHYSENAIEWNCTDSITDNLQLRAITYGAGQFVAVGGSNSVHTICYSKNGIDWTTVPNVAYITSNNVLNDVTYANGKFVAVGDNGAVIYSVDGKSWSRASVNIDDAYVDDLCATTYGNGVFVAISQNSCHYYSEDGVVWTSIDGVYNDTYTSVTYGNGYFVALSLNSNIYASTDGIFWSFVGPIDDIGNYVLTDVTFANGYYVAVGYTTDNGVSVIFTSTDPTGVWTLVYDYGEALYSVVFDGTRFLAVGGTNDYAAIYSASFPTTIKKLSYEAKIITKTLPKSQTSLTIFDNSITDDSLLTFYTSIFGVNPTNVVASTGSVTLTFDAQEVDMEVGVRVNG